MQTLALKEVGSTGLLISRDGLIVYYESLGEWYEFPTEKPSDFKYRHFNVPRIVWVDGYRIRYVHQAVAMAWEPESFVGKDRANVHHCDFNGFNNSIENLIVLDHSTHVTLHHLIGGKPVSKGEAADLLRRYESIPWEEAFHKYKSGELRTLQDCVDFIKERTGVTICQASVSWNFKQLNSGLNPSGRKTREFIALDNPALIEAFEKYKSGGLKTLQDCVDFIKERSGKSVALITVNMKFKQLNGGLNPGGHKTRETISLNNPALIEAFEKYQAGELKNHQEATDFIKERSGISVTRRTVSNKFQELRGSF